MYRMDAKSQVSSPCARATTIPEWLPSGHMQHGCRSDAALTTAFVAYGNKLRCEWLMIDNLTAATLDLTSHSALYHRRPPFNNSAPPCRPAVTSKSHPDPSGSRCTFLRHSLRRGLPVIIPLYSFADQTP